MQIVKAYGLGGGTVDLNTFIAAFGSDLKLHLKLDDLNGTTTAADASGNGNTGTYTNGSYAPGGYLYPDKERSPLATGSTYSIKTSGGGNDELHVPAPFAANFLGGGSWTIGSFVQSTTTTGAPNQWGSTSIRARIAFNHNYATGLTSSGALGITFDQTGADANTLTATATGWNDGNVHLVLFEYDASGSGSLSIWLDGTRIATRAYAGTVPTTSFLAGQLFILAYTQGMAGLGMDNFVAIQRVLTSDEHAAFAAYKV